MKNESRQYPFEAFNDKHFDHDKDGRLDLEETLFRDMYLNEIREKSEQDVKNQETEYLKQTVKSNRYIINHIRNYPICKIWHYLLVLCLISW